jgi:CRP-like cAMP-binding protein
MAGEVIFKEGDTGNLMYVILEGEIEILKSVAGSHKTLSILGKGEFFGEMSLLDDSPRSATAMCSQEAKLLVMSDDQLDSYISSNPDFAVKMIRNLARRLRGANKLIEQALAGNSTRTVFEGLVEFAREKGIESTLGRRVNISVFCSWAGQHLGIPDRNVPEILKVLLERGFIVPSAQGEGEVIVKEVTLGRG